MALLMHITNKGFFSMHYVIIWFPKKSDSHEVKSSSNIHHELLISINKIHFAKFYTVLDYSSYSHYYIYHYIEVILSIKILRINELRQFLLVFQLSHYLDIIEVHIARQISTKSDAFFQAMSSHDKLQEDMMKTCQSIKQLR